MRFYTDPEKPRTIGEDGHAAFTIKRVAFVVGDVEVTDEFEKQMAWYFLRYGRWESIERPATVINNELISFDLQGAKDDPNPEQHFLLIGQLSEMIARQFNDMTVEADEVRRLCPTVEPGKLGILIPKEHQGKVLGIWRFMLQPEKAVTSLEPASSLKSPG
jgi:hypothetical protein